MTVSTDVASTARPEEATVSYTGPPDESKFKSLLSALLIQTQERSMFTGTEVHDMLLDLWLALNADNEIPNVPVQTDGPELESVVAPTG